MYHSTSGKVGYQYHHQPLPGYHIPRYLMKKILIHEDKLRASPEVPPPAVLFLRNARNARSLGAVWLTRACGGVR
jgi:hypothetical protein